MALTLSAWDSSRSWCSRLVNDTLPNHSLSIIRIAVGFLYLWFGLMKLPFFPGHSPDEEVIRNTIGIFCDPDMFIIASGMVESALGFLLLTGVWTRFLGIILIGHVLGTFGTFFLNPKYLMEFHGGIYSPSFAGQYIIKNILLLASGFVFALHQPRSHSRFPLRLQVTLTTPDRTYNGLSIDVSLGGVSLLLSTGNGQWNGSSGPMTLEVNFPIEQKIWKVSCTMVYSYFIREGDWLGMCLGCRFSEKDIEVAKILEPYLTGDGRGVLKYFGWALFGSR